MRAHSCLIGLVLLSPVPLMAQSKPAPGVETRYFTSIDGLMDGNADVILKETRQGRTVTAATLDACYSVEKGSGRKDRFVANLTVNGENLTGTAKSLGDGQPVTVVGVAPRGFAGEDRMPATGEPLTKQQTDAIKAWIAAGAKFD